MLKDNRLLIGLGLGLIIGAILLELMNVAISGVVQSDPFNDSILDDNEYSLEELMEIADSLNYNMNEKSVVLYTQSQLDEAILKSKQSIEDSEEPTGTTSYLITIKSGMGAKEVTKLLISADLINDGEPFEKELSRRELNNNIQVGSFEFITKPSLTELINKITSKS